jgi:peptide deformylase
MVTEKIVTIENKESEKFLRKKTVAFDFSKFSKKEIRELIQKMREAMKKANGIGLSANQIGLSYRVFVAQIPDGQGKMKFYAIFNPSIEKFSNEKDVLEEGCLSIPEMYGEVERHSKVTLVGFDQNGKKLKIKAWGLLARVFQHEVDHLDGKLFIDKAKNLHSIKKTAGN